MMLARLLFHCRFACCKGNLFNVGIVSIMAGNNNININQYDDYVTQPPNTADRDSRPLCRLRPRAPTSDDDACIACTGTTVVPGCYLAW